MKTRIQAVVVAVAVLWAVIGVAEEPKAPSVSLLVQPTTLRAGYRDTEAKGNVRVEVSSKAVLPILVRLHPLRRGDTQVYGQFESSGQDWAEIDVSCLPKDADKGVVNLPLRVTGLRSSGQYEGAVDAVSMASGSPVASAKLLLDQAASGFNPVLSSDRLKDDKLELVGTAGDQFVLEISNPPGAPERQFGLSILPPGAGLSVTPDVIQVKAGQVQQAFATFTGHVSPNGPHRVLKIAAKDDPDLFKAIAIDLKDTSRARLLLGCLFSIVMLGAAVSLVINNVFPVQSTKSRHRIKLSQIESQIRGFSRVSPGLQAALLAEAARVRLLNGNLSWYDFSKAEDQLVIERTLAALQERVALVGGLCTLRLQVEQANLVPVTARYEIEEKLRHAEDAVSDCQLAAAQSHVEAAAQLKESSIAPQAMAELRTQLENGIKALLQRKAPNNRNPRAAALVAELGTALPRVPNMPLSTLLETERDYNAIYTYIESGESAMARRPNDAGVEKTVATLLELLTANPVAPQVVSLIGMIDSDLSLRDVEQSIERMEGAIVCNANPRPYELSDYRFEFTDPRIASVAGAARLATFQWDFKDDTSQPNFNHCKHFYIKRIAGKYPWQRKWPVKLEISVTVTAPLSTVAGTFKRNLSVFNTRDVGFGVMGMQIVRFLVTSVIAVSAAFGAQYAVAPDAVTFSTAITAFLFGFSLDQIRSKTSPA